MGFRSTSRSWVSRCRRARWSSGSCRTASRSRGQVLYRIETDKVENDVESPVAGVVHITGVEGETYDVGDPIGEIET